MDYQEALRSIIARLDFEANLLKKEAASTPKGPKLYTHAQLLYAKAGIMAEAKATVLAHITNQPE